jgi:hypothetical protein
MPSLPSSPLDTQYFPQLNLPSYAPRLRPSETGGWQIFDSQRRRYVRLTPEEWVRQHFVHFLIASPTAYPAGAIGNEIEIRVGTTAKRCDSIVFDPKGRPLAIVEYKATTVELTQKVFDQIARYNVALHVNHLLVSNGLRHYCCRLNRERTAFEFLDHIPTYSELLQWGVEE